MLTFKPIVILKKKKKTDHMLRIREIYNEKMLCFRFLTP